MVLLECMQVTFEHCISDITLRTTDVLNAICRSLAKKDKKDAKRQDHDFLMGAYTALP